MYVCTYVCDSCIPPGCAAADMECWLITEGEARRDTTNLFPGVDVYTEYVQY